MRPARIALDPSPRLHPARQRAPGQPLRAASTSTCARIASAFDVKIQRRNESFRVEGAKANAERAVGLLQQLYGRAARPIGADELELAILEAMTTTARAARPTPRPRARAGAADAARPLPRPRRSRPAPAHPAQRPRRPHAEPGRLPEATSSATTSPSASARPAPARPTSRSPARSTRCERNAVQRIILTRPAVEAGERLGFLPGDLAQKVDPYLRPLYDALYELMGIERVGKAFENGDARGRAARLHARPHARTTPSSSSTRRRTPRPSR